MMRHAISSCTALVCVLALADVAHAHAASLDLRVETHDAESLEPALRRALGTVQPAPDGVLTVRDEPDAVRLVYRSHDGRVLERVLEVHEDGSAREEEIVLLAMHLARDEAAAFLPPPAAPAPPPPASKPVHSAWRAHVDGWILPESGFALAAFGVGRAHWQLQAGAGAKLSLGNARGVDPVLAVGGGAHFAPSRRTFVELDALVHVLHRFDDDDNLAGLAQARGTVGVWLGSRVAVWAGPTLSALFVEENELHRAPGFALQLAEEEPSIQLWPGAALGVRIRLGGEQP